MAGSKTLKVIIAGDAKGALSAMGDVESKSGGLAGKFGMVGQAAALGFAAVGAAAVGAGVALFKIGDNFSQAYDTIRVKTGATGQALEGLKDDLKATLSQVPASIEDAGTAIATLNQRLGLVGKPLEDLSVQFLNLSRITKVDLGTAIADLTRVFGDWSIKDQTKAMDEMFRASQKTGIGIDRLSEQVVQFGAPLRGLGFGFEDSLAMLGKWEKEGVNVENVMGAMKKAFGQFSKEFGQKAPEEFRKFLTEISKAPNASAAAAIAIQKLGVRNGPDFAAAVKEGRFAYGDLVDAIEHGTDTINSAAGDTEHLAEKWQKFLNRIQVAVEPLASGLFDALSRAMDGLSPAFSEIGEKARIAYDGLRLFVGAFTGQGADVQVNSWTNQIIDFAAKARAAFDVVAGAARSFFDQVLRPVGEWIQARLNDTILPGLQSLLQWFANTGWPAISDAARAFYETVLRPMFEFIGNNKEQFKNLGIALAVVAGVIVAALASLAVLQGVLLALAGVLVGAVITAVVAFVAVLSRFAQIAWDVFNNVRDALGGALDFIENGVQVVWDVIQNVASGIAKFPGVVATVASAVAGVISTIVGAVVGFATQLPGLVAGWAQAFWGWLEELQATLPGRLAYIAGFIVGWVVGTGLKAAENLVGWAQYFYDWAQTTATEFPGHLASVASALWGWVSSTAAALPGQVASITAQIWAWVSGIAAALPALLAGWAAQFAGWAAGLAGSIGSWLAATTGAMAGWMWGVASSIPGWVGGWLSAFRDWAGNLAGSIGGWLSGTTASLIGWVLSIPGALGGAISGMLDVGRRIVEGIWQGIQNAGGWLRDKITSFASGIVDGFMHAIGARSPARKLEPVGMYTTQGIAVGMLKEAPRLNAAAVELMGGMQFPTVGGTVSPSLSGVPGGGSLGSFSPASPTALPAVATTGAAVDSGPQMVTVQLVVDRRVLAETVADVSRQRNGALR